jgi:hypothetical protein
VCIKLLSVCTETLIFHFVDFGSDSLLSVYFSSWTCLLCWYGQPVERRDLCEVLCELMCMDDNWE